MEQNVELAKRCLELIRDIAERGASARDEEHIAYALQELSQVLFERIDGDARVFQVQSAADLEDLSHLYQELLFVDGASEDMFQAAMDVP
jgi:hypothetical protein